MLAMNNSCLISVKTLRAVEGSRRGLRRVLTFVHEELFALPLGGVVMLL